MVRIWRRSTTVWPFFFDERAPKLRLLSVAVSVVVDLKIYFPFVVGIVALFSFATSNFSSGIFPRDSFDYYYSVTNEFDLI